MYCSTCGARVPEGRTRCDNCGAPVSRPAGYGVPAAAPNGALAPLPTCPRCGFHGEGISYFSQGAPVAGLLVLALMTLPFLGAGGLIYYLMRHDYRVCPRCGESWGRRAERARLLAGPAAPAAGLGAGEAELVVEGGNGLRIGAWALFVFALMLLIPGIAEGEFVLLLMATLSAGGGAAMLRAHGRAREERRHALLVGLQQPVLRLAGERGGRLTVTEVASSLGWPMRRAEKVLNSLEDGLRVASDVTDQGVIVYEFRELMHTPRLSAAEMDALLDPGGEGTMRA